MRKAAEIATEFDAIDKLDGINQFFLVGIGGAGMGALARLLRHEGYDVTGDDAYESPATLALQAEGVELRIGHSGEGIHPGQALILTDAIDLTQSPEVARARELGVPMYRRSQALGWLLKRYDVIAVTGTHGKTTTTGLLGTALTKAGVDPTIVVGAAIPSWGGPVRFGKGKWAVVEACEAYDSFHDLFPKVVLLTNLEADHLDYHGSYEHLLDSVQRFANKAETLIYCAEDKGACEVAAKHPHAMPYALQSGHELTLPGRHNLLNASGAAKVGELLSLSSAQIWQGLAEFKGAERRLQVIQEGPVTVIDDYAHHPQEISASIEALRSRYPQRRLVVVYQPHLYSRTRDFLPEFAKALSAADVLYITDIYPAREDPIPGISSARIAEQVTCETHYVPSRHLLPREVAKNTKPDDVVVGMGAGTIQEFCPSFVAELNRKAPGNRVLVLEGGSSAEREVSLLSGRAVAAALTRKGYEVTRADITEILLKGSSTKFLTGPERPDVVFLAVHGNDAEDGAIQGFLQLLKLPYTGSGLRASALAMDKAGAKQLLAQAGLPVAQGVVTSDPTEMLAFPVPYVVKPNAQGSTVGLTFVDHAKDLMQAISKAASYDPSGQALVEEKLVGMEISVPVLGDKALLPVEIAPKSGKYDFASKYEPGATEEIVPARLAPEVIEQVQALALKAHQTLGCKGATRTDMIVVGNIRPVILEVNTLPGMAPTSLLPNSAAASGISMEDLCEWIVKDALHTHA